MISEDVHAELASAKVRQAPRQWSGWAGFVLIGALVWLALYAVFEVQVRRSGADNPFLEIAAAPYQDYDVVIVGASHALPFGFEDMNARLEEMTGARILNLAVEGGGIVPTRLVLEYFLARHEARNVLYVMDTFVLYAPTWNEDRLADAKLVRHAPLDPVLARLLWRYPGARGLLPGYLSGFYKINDPDRFAPDAEAADADFRKTYRPIAQIDRRRLAYLYPEEADQAAVERYLAELEALIDLLARHGVRLLVIKPPLPERVLERLPGEAAMDARLRDLVERRGMVFRDFARVANDDAHYYDTDHLNRDGVLAFYDAALAPFLRDHLDGPAASR